ncbi:hypothetical protein SUGI_0095900 [Cryptomeria japonica]|nr:hypothetical protein SUGI_0095900 [Cryptomeria japonica]
MRDGILWRLHRVNRSRFGKLYHVMNKPVQIRKRRTSLPNSFKCCLLQLHAPFSQLLRLGTLHQSPHAFLNLLPFDHQIFINVHTFQVNANLPHVLNGFWGIDGACGFRMTGGLGIPLSLRSPLFDCFREACSAHFGDKAAITSLMVDGGTL